MPTTILAQPHYNTFAQRMKDFPVRIDLMSRFRTPSAQKKTVEDLLKGQVDIVIGTHRILSADIQFKDCLLYTSRSYRDLPLRMGELGLVHRHEKSGQLHGLMRVRCFTPVSYTHLPAASSISVIMEVVVVLPWVPLTPMGVL